MAEQAGVPIEKRPCSWAATAHDTPQGRIVLLELTTPETTFKVLLLPEGATKLADTIARAAAAPPHIIVPNGPLANGNGATH